MNIIQKGPGAMKRPLPVTIAGLLFIVTGLVGLIYHLSDRPVEPYIVLVSLVRITAVVGGVFLLIGHNWARWLLLAWLAFHVTLSAFHSLSQTLAHVVLLIVIAIALLRPPASDYFRSTSAV
jgi:uncharacterized membrane protein HdeD (DUF308 family)